MRMAKYGPAELPRFLDVSSPSFRVFLQVLEDGVVHVLKHEVQPPLSKHLDEVDNVVKGTVSKCASSAPSSTCSSSSLSLNFLIATICPVSLCRHLARPRTCPHRWCPGFRSSPWWRLPEGASFKNGPLVPYAYIVTRGEDTNKYLPGAPELRPEPRL